MLVELKFLACLALNLNEKQAKVKFLDVVAEFRRLLFYLEGEYSSNFLPIASSIC